MGRRIITVLAVVVVVVIFGRRILTSGTAPLPEPFASAPALAQASAESKASGKPVLAFATADWCGPCQSFKRGALSDAEVSAYIATNTHPVVLDCTNTNADAARFTVSGVPALLLLRGEGDQAKVVARTGGVLSKNELLAWLRENTEAK